MYGMRRWVWWALVLFAALYLLRQPTDAAATVNTVFAGLVTAADSLSAFVGALS